MKMALLPGLLTVLVTWQTLFMVVDSAPVSCFEAHAELELYDKYWALCRTGSLTTEEKLTGQCDPECQALLTSVFRSCQVGDTVDESANLIVPYQPGFLYHEFYQNQFFSTWASCDFGYQPTQCDTAYGNLHISRSSIWSNDQIIYNEDACLSESNESECSPECKSFIDQVVIHCDTPEQTTFSPNKGFFELTHKVLQWNHVDSMTKLGFNPTSEDYPYEPLSEPCWQYYETQAEEESPTSIDEPSAPSEPYYKECRNAYTEVKGSSLCGGGTQCSTSCQVLIDRVDDTCSEGDALLVRESGAYLEYKGSALYHDLVLGSYSPISSTCQFGKFQPTACDIAYGQLLRNVGYGGICYNASSEDNSSTCAPDCRIIIEQVVNDCDVPADSTFSPGHDYIDMDQKYEVISWVFPDSMEKSGFNPATGFDSVTEPCWEFYKEQGKLAHNDDTATSISPTKEPATSSSTDAACDAAYSATENGGAFLGEKCTGGNDASCPQSCEDMFTDLHNTCAGKNFTTILDDEVFVGPYDPTVVLWFSFDLDDACKSSPVLSLISRDDLTCTESLTISHFAGPLFCAEGCSRLCMDILDKVYASCTATTELVSVDGEVIGTAEEIEATMIARRSDECNAYAGTLEWSTFPDTPREPEMPVTKGPTATPSQAPQARTVSLPEITTAPAASPQQSVVVTEEPSSPNANLVTTQTSSPVVAQTTDTALASAAAATSRGCFLLLATLASSILVSALW